MSNLFDLSRKVAVITGGDKGIGKALALALASHGANIVVAARNQTKTAETVKEINKTHGVRAEGIELDVLKDTMIVDAVKKAVKAFGKINILINNSGIAEGKKPQDVSTEEWDRVLSTNLRGAFLLSKEVYPHMKSAGGGKIINIGSMASIFGCGVLPAYASSKGGIVQLTKSLAVAWAPDNIQVNAILPGWYKTDLGGELKGSDEAHDKRIRALTPMGRFGETHELGGAAIFLASQASNFITGASIPVDGGYSVCLNGLDGPFA
jgi:2-dehydro-3-deoxy-D-gluconate 5-dehydrogenase